MPMAEVEGFQMQLHVLDIVIIVVYLLSTVLIGYWVSKRASHSMQAYFLGGNKMPWYVLGISNASGMFDISGTMLLVYWMFIYGLKSVWIPWLWPTFNQIFLMVYLSAWLRRSKVMTGAEWIKTRFGTGRGAQLSHLIVVIYAFVSIIGFFSYGFKGIGKFAANFLDPTFLALTSQRWHPSPNMYALVLVAVTALYVIKGGMISVVITEVVQFCILSIASFAVGIIAMMRVSPAALHKMVPAGWDNVFFGWHLNLDWSNLILAANQKIIDDKYELFGFFIMMLLFKGILISAAGPAPNYDMQRVLSSKNPREASMMSAWVNVVLTFPRYFLIIGLTVLAAAFFSGDIVKMGKDMDFELVLPMALRSFVPVGLLGFLIAGLLAAFMSNFAATVNAAPPYFVNDIYKRFINPHAQPKTYVRLSYLASFAVVVIGVFIGWNVTSVKDVVEWIVTGLWAGYTASNVLKWYWWRFNGFGYFWGMVTGISSALVLAFPKLLENVPAVRSLLARYPVNLNVTIVFPVVLVVSLTGCLLGTLLTRPEDDAVLKDFYRRVRPWGFWGPVLKKVLAEEPGFKRNKDFGRDMFNIVVGIVWQVSLVVLPLYIVIQEFDRAAITAAIILGTSVILKFTWYDHLSVREVETDKAAANDQ
ncbi:MAG TPA: sodium:solute symporter family protein [Terracidiphilus sp.]|nr:sodium:solute symporter family protein [Terracidiphilus sp.]